MVDTGVTRLYQIYPSVDAFEAGMYLIFLFVNSGVTRPYGVFLLAYTGSNTKYLLWRISPKVGYTE